MSSSLPIAKSLDVGRPLDPAKSNIAGRSSIAGRSGVAKKSGTDVQPTARQEDSLGNLIEEALRERKNPPHLEKQLANSQGIPIPNQSSNTGWIWFAVGGGVLFFVILAVLIVLRLQG